jgi:PPOX class probable F420-dependent enzyme
VNSQKKESGQQSSDVSDALGALHDAKYLSLESYRRSGTGVRTPVWFAAGAEDFTNSDNRKLYVYTTADSGKAKRVRRCSTVRIAACDLRGRATAPWTDAVAEVVTGEESELGMRLLDRKYFPWKQLLNLSAMLFRRRERIVIAIRVATNGHHNTEIESGSE